MLFFQIGIKAQMYHPMPDTNAVWKEWYAALIQTPYVLYTDHFLDGDTTINSFAYNKVYADVYSPTTGIYWYHRYDGAMRDDSVSKTVYFVPKDSAIEVLLYDFNLTLGQVFPLTWYSRVNYNPDTVAIIDSVWVGTSWHRRYRSTSGIHNIVEGLGSAGGLLEAHLTSGAEFTDLRCFYQNNAPAWPDTATGCATPVGYTLFEATHEINVYPQPSEGVIFIDNFNVGFQKLTVYSADGRLIRSEQIPSAGRMEVDLTNQPEGLYFLQFSDLQERNYFQKIIIAR